MITGLLGALVGAFLALTGAGGGIIAIPLLVFVLGLPIQEASAISLLSIGVAASISTLIGLRQKIVRYKAALLMGLCGMVVAPLGVTIAHRLPQSVLLFSFALLMASLSIKQLIGTNPGTDHSPPLPSCRLSTQEGKFIWNTRCLSIIGTTGALSGLMSGLFGVGGGFIIIPSLSYFSALPLMSVQATSLAAIALVSLAATLFSSFNGHIAANTAIEFTMGMALSLLALRPLAASLPPLLLKKIFYWTCLLSACLVAFKGWQQLN